MATNHIVTEVEEMAASTVCEYILQTAPEAPGYYCRHCLGLMTLGTTPAGEPVIECKHCGWTVAAVETVITEVFKTDSRLAKIVKLMATTGASYELAASAIADCCGGR